MAAVVVVATGGMYLGVRSGSGPSLPTSGLATMWTQDTGECSVASSGPGVLSWNADGLAVWCAGNGMLAAYRLSSGHVAWTWHTPVVNQPYQGSLASIYETSATTDDGIGVVGYEDSDGAPAALAGLDIATGRQLWELSATAAQAISPPGIWEGDGRFAAVISSGSSSALQVHDLATGALVWSSSSRQIPAAGCNVSDDAISGPWIYAVTACSNGTDQLYQMSLQTGSVIAQAPLQDGSCNLGPGGPPTLWAIGGYVVSGCTYANQGQLTRPDIVIIHAGGLLQRALTWRGNYRDLNELAVQPSQLGVMGMAIDGSTLYVGQDTSNQEPLDQGSGSQEVEEIAAIDLSTARLRWYKTISVLGGYPASTTFPVFVIGASSKGAFDVIENVWSLRSPNPDRNSTTLALVSAADGTVSYGPGATSHWSPDGRGPWFALDGNVLLSFGSCPTDGCPDGGNGVTVTAYSLGSWPG